VAVCAGLRALTTLTLVQVQVQDALDAYRAGDAERARAVRAGDDQVERVQAGRVATVMEVMGRTGDDVDALTMGASVLWIALERIADRATHICARVVCIVSGERHPWIAA